MGLEFLWSLLREWGLWIGYVSRGASFPRPLTPEGEKALLARLAEGDSEARDALIEHNLRLVAHIAKKYTGERRELDDMVSIGSIGLIKAVNTYNPSLASGLSSYASRCIENEIRMYLRATKKTESDISLEGPVGMDDSGNAVALMELLAGEEDGVLETVSLSLETEKVRRCVRERLSPREQTVIALRYGLGGREPQTQRQVAKVLGISRSYVSRIEKHALETLRRLLEKGEPG